MLSSSCTSEYSFSSPSLKKLPKLQKIWFILCASNLESLSSLVSSWQKIGGFQDISLTGLPRTSWLRLEVEAEIENFARKSTFHEGRMAPLCLPMISSNSRFLASSSDCKAIFSLMLVVLCFGFAPWFLCDLFNCFWKVSFAT